MTGSGLGGPEHKSLEHALLIVRQAFDTEAFLVGSAAESGEYRDVDVRIILNDDRFCEIFGKDIPYGVNPLWSLITTAVSEYLVKRTGLPIDFQIQCRSMVREADWKKPRHPMALFVRGTEL